MADHDSLESDLSEYMENGDDSIGENGDAEITSSQVYQELETIKARVKEMEEYAEKLKQMQTGVENQMNMGRPPATAGLRLNLSFNEKVEVDNRSIYVGNVDYGATAESLVTNFHGCGSVNRVTILRNKFNGQPKGFAYIEFADKDSVQTAMAMDESLFLGRQIKVIPKRTNLPGFSTTNRGFRGRRGSRFARGAYYGRIARTTRAYRRPFFFPYAWN